jgi:hypothetical protein
MVSIQEFFSCNSHCTPVGYDLEFCIDAGSVMSLISKDLDIQNSPWTLSATNQGRRQMENHVRHLSQSTGTPGSIDYGFSNKPDVLSVG